MYWTETQAPQDFGYYIILRANDVTRTKNNTLVNTALKVGD
jgi:hypothetical protein